MVHNLNFPLHSVVDRPTVETVHEDHNESCALYDDAIDMFEDFGNGPCNRPGSNVQMVTSTHQERAHDNNVRRTLRPRALYSALFVWVSIVSGRFLAVFLEQEANLQESQIGVLLAVSSFTNVISSSVMSSWADVLEQRNPGSGRAQVMKLGVSIGGFIFMLHGLKQIFPDVHFFQSMTWFFLLRVIYSASTSFLFPVLDGICLDFLKKSTTNKDYGRERLYGAISWALANLIMAPCLDSSFGFKSLYPLCVFSSIMLLGMIHIYSLQEDQQSKLLTQSSHGEIVNVMTSEDGDTLTSLSMTALLRIIIASWFGFAFVFAMVTLSSGQAIVENLVFLYFEYLGSSYTLMGFTVVLTVAFEIPIFHIAPTLLKRFGSGNLLIIACFSYAIRVIGYTLVPKGRILYVLLLEPLHGVTFACSATAGVDFVSTLMPSRYEASGQGLLQLFVGCGSVLGLISGGLAQEHLGPRLMYRIAAFFVFLGGAIFFMTLNYHGKQYAGSTLILSTEDSLEMTSTSATNNQVGGRKDNEYRI
jgi:hypothetical protein